MRVLVTRPEPDASRTAAAVAARGHEVVLSPVSRIDPVSAPPPQGPFDIVLATSANALRHADPDLLRRMSALPFLGVGTQTAATARGAGFLTVRAAGGSAPQLAELARQAASGGARLLYLAGDPRKPDLEARLGEAGFRIVTHVCYRTRTAERLSAEAEAGLRSGAIGAALHFSRESAARFARLAADAGLAEPSRNLVHCCLSSDTATGLSALGRPRLRIAAQPNEEELLILLDKDH